MAVNIFGDLPEEQFEENFDANFTGLPLRKGRYEGIITFADDEVNPAEQWDAVAGGPPTHYRTRLKAIVDGRGARAYANISTKPFKAGKDTEKMTSMAVRLLQRLGEKERATEATTPVDLARAITNVLAGGVHAIFDVDWETSYQDQGQWVNVRGEENFPKDGEGNPIPTIIAPDGKECRARATFQVVAAA